MLEHRGEIVSGIELPNEAERPPLPQDMLYRQLGRSSFEGLKLAEPTETHPLEEIENNLKSAIVGQHEAIEAIMSALNREKFRNPNRPIATMLFLGPTGVGKSETAKELDRLLHGDEEGLLKIDCSSYSHGHEVAALVGAPPSFVGREQKPGFDSDILDIDRNIVLFDEIEKGSQPLWDLMLQIMDDGELTLTGSGKKASFKKSIVILTSNLGATEMMGLLKAKTSGFQSSMKDSRAVTKERIEIAAMSALGNYFRPEFINRIDNKIVFPPLDDAAHIEVLDRYVSKANLQYRNAGISLELSPLVSSVLVNSTDERRQFGARPILRKYEAIVEASLGKYVNMGQIPEGHKVYALYKSSTGNENEIHADDVEFWYEYDDELQQHMSRQREIGSTVTVPEFLNEPQHTTDLVKMPLEDE